MCKMNALWYAHILIYLVTKKICFCKSTKTIKKMENLKEQKLVEPKVVNTKTTDTKQVDIFRVIKHENKVYIILGNVIISQKKFKTFKEAIEYINSKPYELIINTACYAMETSKSQQNETSK